ncbi:MAG: CotH kinase family protein, partial [Bacteroidetes bacterium]|nr:CotH kinase family protein [Bacteroidota bacterium]
RENPKPIPTIHIYTEGGLPVDSKEDYRNATFTLDGQGTCDNIGETDLRIRGRGNSTWVYPKKPYRLNFNTAISLFDLPAARNWVLLASYSDPFFMFDPVAFELSRRLNMPWTNNTFYVELYLNDDYLGIYQLTEHISSNVVLSGNDILFEIDNQMDEDYQFYSNLLELPIMISNPSNQATLDRAKLIWDNIENTLFGPVYENAPEVLDSNGGWRDLFNLQSVMSYMLVREVMHFVGAPMWGNSFYMRYIESDGKIHFGPQWDFNDSTIKIYFDPLALSYISYRPFPTYTLLVRERPCEKLLFRFLDDPKFVREYKQYANSVIGQLNADRYIDSLIAVLKPYMAKEYARWEQYNNQEDVLFPWFKGFHRTRINLIKNYIDE